MELTRPVDADLDESKVAWKSAGEGAENHFPKCPKSTEVLLTIQPPFLQSEDECSLLGIIQSKNLDPHPGPTPY